MLGIGGLSDVVLGMVVLCGTGEGGDDRFGVWNALGISVAGDLAFVVMTAFDVLGLVVCFFFPCSSSVKRIFLNIMSKLSSFTTHVLQLFYRQEKVL